MEKERQTTYCSSWKSPDLSLLKCPMRVCWEGERVEHGTIKGGHDLWMFFLWKAGVTFASLKK